jgi:uncharacterized protein YwlG (UPF0340 family)
MITKIVAAPYQNIQNSITKTKVTLAISREKKLESYSENNDRLENRNKIVL